MFSFPTCHHTPAVPSQSLLVDSLEFWLFAQPISHNFLHELINASNLPTQLIILNRLKSIADFCCINVTVHNLPPPPVYLLKLGVEGERPPLEVNLCIHQHLYWAVFVILKHRIW